MSWTGWFSLFVGLGCDAYLMTSMIFLFILIYCLFWNVLFIGETLPKFCKIPNWFTFWLVASRFGINLGCYIYMMNTIYQSYGFISGWSFFMSYLLWWDIHSQFLFIFRMAYCVKSVRIVALYLLMILLVVRSHTYAGVVTTLLWSLSRFLLIFVVSPHCDLCWMAALHDDDIMKSYG
jgi:hypothetical protein